MPTNEPVITAATLSAVVSAVLLAFGIKLTDDLNSAVDALLVAVAAAVPLVTGWLARRKVRPVVKLGQDELARIANEQH